MPKYERFSWMEASDFNFIGSSIRYDSDCVNQDASSNVVETNLSVTTDLEFIYNSPEAIDDDGWVILQNTDTGGGVYNVEVELSVSSVTTKWNMHLAWCNLHHNYFMHNRVMIEGYINNSFVTFYTAQRTKVQECSAIVCYGYDPDDNITTELGETYFGGEKARVESAEIHPSGEIRFSLLYGTHYVTPAPQPPDKWVQILLVPGSGCTHFHALLSEAAPVGGLSIEFRYVIRPEVGPAICANDEGDDVWVIAEGLISDNYDITLDCAIPADGCIYYWHPGAGDIPGWTIVFDDDTANECKC
jgi:hypothetical protein